MTANDNNIQSNTELSLFFVFPKVLNMHWQALESPIEKFLNSICHLIHLKFNRWDMESDDIASLGHNELIVILQTKLLSLTASDRSGPQFNIKMTSHQYKKPHCGDKTILRPSYLHNGISYTHKMISLYWIRAQEVNGAIWWDESQIPVPCWGLNVMENQYTNWNWLCWCFQWWGD